MALGINTRLPATIPGNLPRTASELPTRKARIIAPAGLFAGIAIINILLRARFDIVVNDVTCVRTRAPYPLTDIASWLLNRGQLFYRPLETWLQFAEWEAFGTNWLPGIILHCVMLGAVGALVYWIVMELARDRIAAPRLRMFIAVAAALLYCLSFRMIEVTWLIFQKSMLTEIYVLPGLLGYLLYRRTGQNRWLVPIIIGGILGPLTRELPASLAAVLLFLVIFTKKRDPKFAVVTLLLGFHALFPIFFPSLLLGYKLNMYALFGQGLSRGLLVGDNAGPIINFDLPFRAALFYSPFLIIATFAAITLFYLSKKNPRGNLMGASTICVLVLSLISIYFPKINILAQSTPILFTLVLCVSGYQRYGLFLPAMFVMPLVPFIFVPAYDVWVRLPALAFLIMALLWVIELPREIRILAGGKRQGSTARAVSGALAIGFIAFVFVLQIPNLPASELTNIRFIQTHKDIANWFVDNVPQGSGLISNLRQTFDIDWYSGQHVTAYYAPFTPEQLPPLGPMPGGRGEPVSKILDRKAAYPDTPIYFIINESFGRFGLPQLPSSEMQKLQSFNVSYDYPVFDPLKIILPKDFTTFYGPTDLGFQQEIDSNFITNVSCTYDIYRFTGTYASLQQAFDRVPAASPHVPIPWGKYLGFNVEADGPQLYATPEADGSYDAERIKNGAYTVILTGKNLAEVRQEIDNYSHPTAPVVLVDNYRGMTILGAYGETYAVPADDLLNSAKFSGPLPEAALERINSGQFSLALTGKTIHDVINKIDDEPSLASFPGLALADANFEDANPLPAWQPLDASALQQDIYVKSGAYALKLTAAKSEVTPDATNLLPASSEPLKGWDTYDSRIELSSTVVRANSPTIKITANKPQAISGDAGASRNVFKTAYRGRTFTFGAWVMAPVTNDKIQALGIWDGVEVTYSDPVPHDGKWHWAAVTRTLDGKATDLRAYAYALNGKVADTDDTLYVDAAMLTEGKPATGAGVCQDIFKQDYRGRTFTFSAWTMAPASNDKTQALGISDGAATAYSSPIAHDGLWHWTTVTKKVDGNASELRAGAYVLKGNDPDSDDILYVDNASMVPTLLTGDTNFEKETSQEGWDMFDSIIGRDSAVAKTGSSSLKITANKTTFGDAGASQNVFKPEYRNHVFTFGAWVMAPAANDKTQTLGVWDGTGVVYSPVIPRDGQWHWVTISKTLDRNASELRVYAYVLSSADADTDDALYIDSPLLIPGDYIPPYPGEE